MLVCYKHRVIHRREYPALGTFSKLSVYFMLIKQYLELYLETVGLWVWVFFLFSLTRAKAWIMVYTQNSCSMNYHVPRTRFDGCWVMLETQLGRVLPQKLLRAHCCHLRTESVFNGCQLCPDYNLPLSCFFFFFFFLTITNKSKPALYLEISYQLKLLISFSNLFLLCFYIMPEEMLQACKCECPNLFFSF